MRQFLLPLLLLLLIIIVLSINFSVVDGSKPLEFSFQREVPYGWSRLSISSFRDNQQVVENIVETTTKEIIVAIKQTNLKHFDDLFWKISDPKNKEFYGKFLTTEEMTDLISPTQDSIEAIKSWFADYTSTPLIFNQNRDIAKIELPIDVLSNLLKCKFEAFQHQASGIIHITSLGPYYVPDELVEHIDFIAGVVDFPLTKRDVHPPFVRPSSSREEAEEDTSSNQPKEITPPVIRARYNVTQIVTNVQTSNAVAEFGDNFSPNDLVKFFDQYVVDGKQFDTVAEVIGPNNPKRPGGEASLDIQYLMGVAPNAKSWFIQFNSGDGFWKDFTAWTTYLGNTTGVPLIHSVSWGSSQFAGGFPSKQYRERMEVELQKLGAQGFSILIASGDNGVGCYKDQCHFLDDYPAESKFVTAVGATAFITGNTGDERAVNYPGEFTSGGGFSWLFERPSYQQAPVQHYLETATSLPLNTSYNASGRATADFSALGAEEYQVIINGRVQSIGGTSASTPTFAAIITLLNDVRFNNNLPPLGFLNPLFYQIAQETPGSFFDVTIGNDNWPCDCPSQNGFSCNIGWDPATGMGTPNFAVLQNEILKPFL